MKYSVVIPARMDSSRFPGKPLEKIAGLPLVEHVRRRALLASGVDQVVVATCDIQIKDYIESQGGIVVMTSDSHERCTARVAEAAQSMKCDYVAVVQGDEPLLFPESIEQAVAPFLDGEDVDCVSLLSPLEGREDLGNTNIVKAACNLNQRILYFSRAAIPHFQASEKDPPVYRETGIRALTHDFLMKYASLEETPLERIESVDMFRLLEHGFSILGVKTDYATIGVDHPEDVTIAERMLSEDPVQQKWFKQILN
ncbi:MAG: 3-deoxy-manno-octulosonate cytidylyltransferase [Verrucomicrobiota bacterium]